MGDHPLAAVFVFEILDWYNPYMNFFGPEGFRRFDDSLLPAHLGAVGLGTPYPLAEIPREETLPFHQTPACSSQGAGQTAGTVTRTVGQVLLYGKILTPIFPKDNFFLNRSQAMGEETPEGLQQTRVSLEGHPSFWCMRLWGYRYRLTRPPILAIRFPRRSPGTTAPPPG